MEINFGSPESYAGLKFRNLGLPHNPLGKLNIRAISSIDAEIELNHSCFILFGRTETFVLVLINLCTETNISDRYFRALFT